MNAEQKIEADLQHFGSELALGHTELLAMEKEYCSRSLRNFVKRAWHVVEPAAPYKHGWHLDAIFEHLEAVMSTQIKRLAIEVPPGAMKSLSTAVFMPAFEWGPGGKPHIRVAAASHSEALAARDNLRTKRLIESEWYMQRWGDKVILRKDQSSKLNFENTMTGFRQATPFTSITGKRADRVIIDDPLSVADADQEIVRDKVNQLFREAVPSRMVDPVNSAIIVIMQRLHEDDLIGHIRAHPEWGFEHLMIPMEFDPDRKCKTIIGWEDPRRKEGELMFPERFPRHVVERDKEIMGEYAAAGQFQQMPVPRSGGSFQPDKIDTIQASELDEEEIVWGRGWDLAGTKKKNSAYTAGVKIGFRKKKRRWVIAHAVRDRLRPDGVRNLMRVTAESDGDDCYIVFPKDPGQAGVAQAEDIVSDLSGYSITAEPQSGSKETRADPFAAQVNAGLVDMVEGPWNEAFINEMRFFPRGKFKDQIDAASSAFNHVSKKLRKKKIPVLAVVAGTEVNWADPNHG